MKYLILLPVLGALIMGCGGKKPAQTTKQQPLADLALIDSIDRTIAGYERRLDVKMKRKTYETQPGTVVTLQKWFEYGDTTRLLKLREEILTNARMDIVQFHYIDGKLAEIHEYTYNTNCGDNKKQCMEEAKYFFEQKTLKVAQKRHAEGTPKHVPVIEQSSFVPFQPAGKVASEQQEKVAQINKKYASLPYPKRRSEQGTSIQAR